MTKSVFTPAYKELLEALISMRIEQEVTQVELARRLRKPQQFVSRYELGIRRVDLVEFYAIVTALGIDPKAAFARATADFSTHLPI